MDLEELAPIKHLRYDMLLPKVTALAEVCPIPIVPSTPSQRIDETASQSRPLAFPTPTNNVSAPSYEALRIHACAAAVQRSFTLSLGRTIRQGTMANKRFILRCNLYGPPHECPVPVSIERADAEGSERWIVVELEGKHNHEGAEDVEEGSDGTEVVWDDRGPRYDSKRPQPDSSSRPSELGRGAKKALGKAQAWLEHEESAELEREEVDLGDEQDSDSGSEYGVEEDRKLNAFRSH